MVQRPKRKAPTAPTDSILGAEVVEPPKISATPYLWIDPSQIAKRQWLYRPHYVRQFVSLTVSTGGVGKSSLTLAEALAMASGNPILGVQPAGMLRVWYWNGEDPLEELQRRVAATAKHYRLTERELAGRLFIDSGRETPIVIAEEDQRRRTKIGLSVVEQLIATIRQNQIDVVIIDPFVTCHRVSENDNGAIERVAKTWAHVAEVCNCVVMLVHHTRKTGVDGATVDDGRGASALLAAVRTARTLNTMTKNEAENAGVDEEERRLHFRLDIGKTNLARPAESAQWFKLVSVDLENSGGGDESDMVGVVTAWDCPQAGLPEFSPEAIRRAQDEIKKGGPWRENQLSVKQPWVGIPIAFALGIDLGEPRKRKAVNRLVKEWLKAGWLKIVDGRDEQQRKVRKFIEAGNVPVNQSKFSKEGKQLQPLGRDGMQLSAPVDEPARPGRPKAQLKQRRAS